MSSTAASPELTERRETIELPDGRSLSWTAFGAQDGPVVLVLDGPGSRGMPRAASRTAAGLGIRLVAPDRPGFGGSDPAPVRSHQATADDLVALMDALGHDRFGILAQSGGTPFALGVAAAAGDRVSGLAFVGAVVPIGEPGALEDVSGPMLTMFRLARRAPFLLRPLLEAAGRSARKDPAKMAKKYAEDLPAADQHVLSDAAMWAIHERGTWEALETPRAFAREARMLARPWDVDLGRITAPVELWVGEKDPVHPPSMAHELARRLGGAPVHVVPDAATFGCVTVYGDVLDFAVREPST
jgi:pimeloyl-ACP methyl ester carboxylesterase